MQLHDPALPKLISDLASEAEFPLQCVCLELTESALVWDTEVACKIAHELKEAGCELALDDFRDGLFESFEPAIAAVRCAQGGPQFHRVDDDE